MPKEETKDRQSRADEMDQPTQETGRKQQEEAEYVMLLREKGAGKPNANIRKRPIDNAEAGKAETNRAVVTERPAPI